MSHLKEQGVRYWDHWYRAIKISLALLIHAFFPNILKDYASKELCNKKSYREVYSADTNKIDEDGGPYEVKI